MKRIIHDLPQETAETLSDGIPEPDREMALHRLLSLLGENARRMHDLRCIWRYGTVQ